MGESSSESCAVCRIELVGVSLCRKCETPASTDADDGRGLDAWPDDVDPGLPALAGVAYDEVASACEM